MAARRLAAEEIEAITAPQGPPSRRRLLGELTALREPARMAIRGGHLLSAPRGDGRTVVLIPGWKTSGAAMAPIGSYLLSLGHKPRNWGLGINDGDVEETRDRLLDWLPDLVSETGRPVNIVGWSLGGVLAREIARSNPGLVHRIVTYGTPAIGGPTHTIGATAQDDGECDRITELQERLDATDPIRVPVTALFTRNDGAVAWRSCIDRTSLDVSMIEVGSSHVGLGLDPDVWLTTAKALAA